MSIASLREKLEVARKSPEAAKTFGAATHGFVLNAPASIASVEAFERALGVGLPPSYRAFVTEIGNGGAGPFHGLFAMGCWDEGSDLFASGMVASTSKPFPHTDVWNWSEERLEELSEDDTGKLTDEYWTPIDGAIPICHEGCALRDWLVVAGPEAGNVWHDATADFGGWYPWQSASGSRLGFDGWYDAWLDAAIAGKRFQPRSPFAWAERRRIDAMLGR